MDATIPVFHFHHHLLDYFICFELWNNQWQIVIDFVHACMILIYNMVLCGSKGKSLEWRFKWVCAPSCSRSLPFCFTLPQQFKWTLVKTVYRMLNRIDQRTISTKMLRYLDHMMRYIHTCTPLCKGVQKYHKMKVYL